MEGTRARGARGEAAVYAAGYLRGSSPARVSVRERLTPELDLKGATAATDFGCMPLSCSPSPRKVLSVGSQSPKKIRALARTFLVDKHLSKQGLSSAWPLSLFSY